MSNRKGRAGAFDKPTASGSRLWWRARVSLRFGARSDVTLVQQLREIPPYRRPTTVGLSRSRVNSAETTASKATEAPADRAASSRISLQPTVVTAKFGPRPEGAKHTEPRRVPSNVPTAQKQQNAAALVERQNLR
jgi:hypothetical protein